MLEKLAPIFAEQLPVQIRARLLLARGVAQNRRGDANAALRDLLDARAAFTAQDDRKGLADVSRELGVVHAWRGAGREAGFAFVRALAEASLDPSHRQTARAIVEAARANIEVGRPQDAIALLKLVLDARDDLAPDERGRVEIMLIKALNDAGDHDVANERVRNLRVEALRPREVLLAQIEGIRCLLSRGYSNEVEHALEVLSRSLPQDENAFEHAEYLSIYCQARLAAGDGTSALAAVEKLIPRVESDNLGAPLVAALGQKARALDLLGRQGEASEAAASALQRAVERQLQREADALRESLILRDEAARALSGLAKGRVDSRFVRSALVGEGGFGRVIRAFDLETGDEVALKQISLSKVMDVALRQRMFESAEREVQAAKSIVHNSIARVIGLFFEVDGDVFVASAFVRGRTLRRALSEGGQRPQWRFLIGQIADALAEIHKCGIVHGDVKPENVIINDSAEGRPVLVDFGSAGVERSAHRRFGVAAFTPAYAAPEQKRSMFRSVGPPADVFALGMLALELISGRRPAPAPAYSLGFLRRAAILRELKEHGADEDRASLLAASVSPWPALRPTAAEIARALSKPPG